VGVVGAVPELGVGEVPAAHLAARWRRPCIRTALPHTRDSACACIGAWTQTRDGASRSGQRRYRAPPFRSRRSPVPTSSSRSPARSSAATGAGQGTSGALIICLRSSAQIALGNRIPRCIGQVDRRYMLTSQWWSLQCSLTALPWNVMYGADLLHTDIGLGGTFIVAAERGEGYCAYTKPSRRARVTTGPGRRPRLLRVGEQGRLHWRLNTTYSPLRKASSLSRQPTWSNA